MKIFLLEPFYTGSHKAWCDELKQFSSHDITILSMSGHYWKWRMHGAAITLARKFLESDLQPDLILCSDMLDLSTFLSLTRERTSRIPTVIYFHENQLTYPWAPNDRDLVNDRNRHYGFINFISALSANRVFFNSKFHHDSFLGSLPNFLKGFPDHNELNAVGLIKSKSEILTLGLDLKKFDVFKKEKKNEISVILWNHRWEHDKNPGDFFKVLASLQEKGIEFRLVVLGENFSQEPEIFNEAKDLFKEKILHFGFVESFEDYAHWLWRSDILPVTSNHDFFGTAVVQAMYCNVYPLLPNRLAYPEHIPKERKEKHIYSGHEDLVNKLENIIVSKNYMKTTHQAYITHYDWTERIAEYDQAFEIIWNQSKHHET